MPADDQWESRAIVGRIVRQQLEALPLRMPVVPKKVKDALAEARELLQKE